MSVPALPLQPLSLATKVDEGTYKRGLGVYRHQQVQEFTVTTSGPGSWLVSGLVQGSELEPYETDVELELDTAGNATHFKSSCDCPVGRNCKHGVALALKAAYKSAAKPVVKPDTVAPSLRSPGPQEQSAYEAILAQIAALQTKAAPLRVAQAGVKKLNSEEKAQQHAQRNVTQWLDLFGQASSSPLDADAATAPTTVSHTAEHLVFLLSGTLAPLVAGLHPVLQLSYGLARKLQSGKWAKVRQPGYLGNSDSDPQALEVVRLIQSQAGRHHSYQAFHHQCTVAGAAGQLALQLAAQSGLLFHSPQDRTMGVPLSWGEPRSIGFEWQQRQPTQLTSTKETFFQPLQDEPIWSLRPVLSGALTGAEIYANAPPLYLLPNAGVCGPLALPGVSPEHLQLLLKAPPIPESAFAKNEITFLRNLAGLPLPSVLVPPQIVQGVAPVWRLHIAPSPAAYAHRMGMLKATLRFDYQGVVVYAAHNQNPVLIDLPPDADNPALRVLLHRDLALEQAAHHGLRAHGLVGDTHGIFVLPFVSQAQQMQWLPWLDDGFADFSAQGFVVTQDADLQGWIARADTLDVQLEGANSHGTDSAPDDSHSPWFDLSLGISIDGQRRNLLPLLPELLRQLEVVRQRQHNQTDDSTALQLPPCIFLLQDGGTYLRVPTEPLRPWLQALLELVSERGVKGAFDGDRLRLSRLEALRMGASLGEGARWQGAGSLRTMMAQLAGQTALPEVTAPASLQATLRPYQLQGLGWLQFLRSHSLGGVLADDMGLGKTLQTLAHVLTEKEAGRLDRPVLVIAPVSLMGNWRREAERFAPSLRTLVLHGKDRHGEATKIPFNDLVIAPYSLLGRDRERWQAQNWHLVVLDEAHNIKNANTDAAQVAGQLNTRHRLCLSGTPMENHLGELWSLFHFLMPGFLSSQARFKQLFRTPIEKFGDTEALRQLRQRVTPFMLRRHKKDVATDLPDKQEFITPVELGDHQANLYETIRLTTEKSVRDALSNKGLAKSQIQILDALLKLRQVCCDPRLVAVPAAQKVKQSAKLELLMELLPELLAEGRKVLLFSQFTSMLSLIEEELAKRQLRWAKLTGQSQKRDQIIERFTSGEVPLFLISLKAGGVGLNLTQADTVIHYDPWWNPAVEMQATDRAHRIGQTRQVMVYKLVAQGTIEERIVALQARKAALANSLYSGSADGEAARKQPMFTETDLQALLQPLGSHF